MTCQGTLPEVQDVSMDPSGGSGRVGVPSRRSGMDREVLQKVWDRSGDPPRGPVLVGGPTQRSGPGQETLR